MALHDTSLDTKTVVYKDTIVDNDTIVDFYNRLNVLRNEAGISLLTIPSIEEEVVTVDNGIEQPFADVIGTKNSITNLKNAILTEPIIPISGIDLLTAKNKIAAIEYSIGTLENHCINFTPVCDAVNSTNRVTFTAAKTSNNGTFFGSNFTANNAPNFVVGNSSFRSNFHSSVFSFTKPHTWYPFHSSRCGTGRSSNWSSNKNSGTATWHSTNFSGFFSSNFSGFCTQNKVTVGNSANFSGFTATNATNFSSVNTAFFGANFGANKDTCTVVHSTFKVE